MLIVIKLNLIILNTSKKQKQLAKDNSFTLPADTFLQAVLLSLICDIHSASTQNCHFLYDRRRPHGRPHFCCNNFLYAGLLQHNTCFQSPFLPFYHSFSLHTALFCCNNFSYAGLLQLFPALSASLIQYRSPQTPFLL